MFSLLYTERSKAFPNQKHFWWRDGGEGGGGEHNSLNSIHHMSPQPTVHRFQQLKLGQLPLGSCSPLDVSQPHARGVLESPSRLSQGGSHPMH